MGWIPVAQKKLAEPSIEVSCLCTNRRALEIEIGDTNQRNERRQSSNSPLTFAYMITFGAQKRAICLSIRINSIALGLIRAQSLQFKGRSSEHKLLKLQRGLPVV
uniref:Uncharacterized protein n=1 Tax=Solanum lycopersicum TaxID=4081 RepID=A0A3Q7FC98_SOLLC